MDRSNVHVQPVGVLNVWKEIHVQHKLMGQPPIKKIKMPLRDSCYCLLLCDVALL